MTAKGVLGVRHLHLGWAAVQADYQAGFALYITRFVRTHTVVHLFPLDISWTQYPHLIYRHK